MNGHCACLSDACRADGRSESTLGRASHPRGIWQARCRRLGANPLAALAATPSSAVTDLAPLPHELPDVDGVVGLPVNLVQTRPRYRTATGRLLSRAPGKALLCSLS